MILDCVRSSLSPLQQDNGQHEFLYNYKYLSFIQSVNIELNIEILNYKLSSLSPLQQDNGQHEFEARLQSFPQCLQVTLGSRGLNIAVHENKLNIQYIHALRQIKVCHSACK